MRLYDLRAEGQPRPICLAARVPRFSWKFADAPRGFLQDFYRVQVSRSDDFSPLVWDSGEVRDTRSHLVEYQGPALEPKVSYWFRAIAGGSGVRAEPWSESCCFELAPSAWGAPFIAAEDEGRGDSSEVRSLRKEFVLPFVPARARLYATALGVYGASINGHPVSDAILAPGWTSYDRRLAFQAYDVTAFIQAGENELRCLVAPGWYKGCLGWRGQRNIYGDRLAFSASLEVDGLSGEALIVETDDSWESASSPWISAELYHGESYDARLEGQERWTRASVVPSPSAAIVPQEGLMVRPKGRLSSARIATPDGSVVYDFGRNFSGVVEISAHGPRGARIVLRHAEVLDAVGNLYFENLRSARQRVEYTLAGGPHESFSPRFCTMGFRFVLVESGAEFLEEESLDAIVYHSDFEADTTFECSHEGLNRLSENIAWGWRSNAVDIPTDCPQRDERLGWTGDAQVFASTALRLSDAGGFFRKWLADLRSDQLPDGGVTLVVPDALSRFRPAEGEVVMGPPHTAAGWSDAAVIVPWEVYRSSGDRRVLEESLPSMRAWVDRVREIAGDSLVWSQSPQLGDWLALDAKPGSFFGATPPDLVATAYFARSAGILAKSFRAVGEEGEAIRYDELSVSIVRAFQREFVTSTGRVAAQTQTANALVLAFGLCLPEHRARVSVDLAALLSTNGGRLTTGFLGTPVLCDALSESGRVDLAYSLLLCEEYPSWLYQVRMGATTIWEHWDGLKPDGSMWDSKMNSFNHYAYGAIGDWMYRNIGGIRLDDDSPGFRRVSLEPRPAAGITRCRHVVGTPYGELSLAWELVGGNLEVEATIPPNAQGRLLLPDGERLLGSGAWKVSAPWEA